MGRHTLFSLLAFCPLFALSPAYADLRVQFTESAPTDRFSITHTGSCELTELQLEIDLKNSQGMLYFDTTDRGAGVDVFQPFRASSQQVALLSAPSVEDGDESLKIAISNLAPNEAAGFTIDVDDRLSSSRLGPTRVENTEIQGAVIRLLNDGATLQEARFDSNAQAQLPKPLC